MHSKYLKNILKINELQDLGVSKNQLNTMLRKGVIQRCDRGVYTYSSFAHALTEYEKPLARIVSAAKCSSNLTLSHLSAALWWGAPVLEKMETVHFSVPNNSTRNQPKTKIHRRRESQCASAVILHGLKVTNALDTLVDCAIEYPVLTTLNVANYFLKEELVAYDEATQALLESSRYRRQRRQQVQKLLNPRCESPLETLVWYHLSSWGIEMPVQQVWVDCGFGKRHRVDFMWFGPKVILEADGQIKYSGVFGDPSTIIREERARQRNLERLGWTVLRVEWHEIQNEPWNLRERLRAAGVK